MKVNLISIGNSKGIRIPQAIIKECGFAEQVELRLSEGVVVLAPVRNLREGWNAAFERMAAAGNDALLVADGMHHDWDQEEWEW